MSDQDVSYSMNSEIDKAFSYINELDKEIEVLKSKIKERKKYYEKQNFIKKLFIPKIPNLLIDDTKNIKRNYYKIKKYDKDGYSFLLRTTRVFNIENTNEPCYYEFFVNIKYSFETKSRQFYKRFYNLEETNKYMKDMEGVFKHLTRRDLMERLFKEKKEEIEYLKNLL